MLDDCKCHSFSSLSLSLSIYIIYYIRGCAYICYLHVLDIMLALIHIYYMCIILFFQDHCLFKQHYYEFLDYLHVLDIMLALIHIYYMCIILFFQDHRLFKQRYYEFLDYYEDSNGPIFLKICGESTCPGILNDYTAVLAKKFGAALISLEHRYYGKSSPFKLTTTENLRFLSSKQALFDLAAFSVYYQDSLNARYNRSNIESPWFVFGVSYSGALSAWFRLKFPHLACGSLASSGVVLAVYNYTEFDKQVGVSAGPACKAVLQEITKLVDEQLSSDSGAVKSLFGASTVKNDVDFLYLLADAAAIAFQYGNPDVLCGPLVDAKNSQKNLV
ncbi:putative serine protease EDA2 [Apostasia shenzhenica]|uniref:Putative serine protease EDA2 n=1 Tax=Apostasia shenzhenica TaxID=1088818 RepID=A0A2H9ZTM3_9ASPA|nr:putative serine protease EDA2 [Apostasia shenzhenica]